MLGPNRLTMHEPENHKPRGGCHFVGQTIVIAIVVSVDIEIDVDVVVVFVSQRSLPKLGGIGKVAEIDEAKVGKRKYKCDRESGVFFIVPVERRATNTLLVNIRERIAVGTIIMSDC
ncbi:hypothetical protein ACLKA7_011708 [Drosophila subpalustris]